MSQQAGQKAAAVALVIAAGLALPSAMLSRFGDDYGQLLAVEGSAFPFKAMFTKYDPFVFADGNPEHVRALVERGALPWWSHPSLKIAFFRPLSSALMVVDHALFGRGEVGPHLHSALWYLALIAVAGLLLRRALPPWIAGAALILYALDDGHAFPVLWLANRNALVAATLGFLGVYLHLRWREDRLRWAAPASAVSFLLALLGGEVALGTIAYVVAYELTRTDDPLARRAKALLPVAVISLGWAVTYKLLGYGASGALMYIDPASQPVDWIVAVLTRGPVLVGALFVGTLADVWMAAPDARGVLIATSVVGSILFFVALGRASRTLAPEVRQRVRWWVLGAILSVLPVISAFPSNRLLVVPGLGALVAVVIVLRHGWRSRSLRPLGVLGMAGATVLVLLHAVLALPTWGGMAFLLHSGEEKGDRIQARLMSQLDKERLPQTRLVTLYSDPLGFMNTAARLWLETGASPKAWWLLSMAPGDHVFRRTGEATLEMELAAADQRLLGSEGELFLRAPPMPMPERETLPGMTIEVAERDPAGIKRLRFTFDVPLEEPSLVLLHWREGVLERLAPPAAGTTWTEQPPPML